MRTLLAVALLTLVGGVAAFNAWRVTSSTAERPPAPREVADAAASAPGKLDGADDPAQAGWEPERRRALRFDPLPAGLMQPAPAPGEPAQKAPTPASAAPTPEAPTPAPAAPTEESQQPPKLSAILWSAEVPALAVIDGTVVAVGDRVGRFAVAGIGRKTVRLAPADGVGEVLHLSLGGKEERP